MYAKIVLCVMKKDLAIKFGDRIRTLRKEKGWSQEKLAEKTDFHRTYIGMVERGERNPSLKNIGIFADTFKMTVSELLNGV
jgi:transcriptional regulator with XRE-family HTH domain